jgi:glycosyltransferase involved in cell wall biosynthesis
VDNDELHELMSAARAFVFAAEEDFGIVAVEAQAHGTPVIALGRGGARETVMVDEPSPTGLFFAEPRADLIAAAMHQFIRDENRYSRVSCHQNAWRFSQECFDSAFKEFVENRWAAYGDKIAGPTRSGPHSRVVAEMQSPVSAIL